MGAMEDGWKRVIRALQEYKTPIGQTGFSGENVTSCALADTWYPVVGIFSNESDINEGFDVVGGDFTALTTGKVTFEGSGNFRVSKQCQLTVGLFVNGVNVAKANTLVNYELINRIYPASRTTALLLNDGDVLDIRVKSSQPSTDVTIGQLNALFIGLRS